MPLAFTFLQDLLLALIHGIGLLALLSIAFGMVERWSFPRLSTALLHGVIFGFGAIIAMMAPARIGDGLLVDARGLIVGFAAAFGGPPAAIVAALISSTYRVWLGGVGAWPGALGIVCAAALGLAWRKYLRPKTRVRPVDLALLGIVVTAYLFSSMVLGVSSGWALITLIGPYMLFASVSASVLLGLFVEREMRQIAREQHWKTRALTDPLTALPNRRAFERGMAGLRPHNRQAALLILDLDHFKVVNDTFGHAAGDFVLQQIAMTLRTTVRLPDLVSRLGGEELAVLLPDTDAAEAAVVAERIRRAIERLVMQWEGQSITITASIGVAVALGSLPTRDLFVQADAALYAAKKGGRNRVVFSGATALRSVVDLEPTKPQDHPQAPNRAA